VAFAVYARLNPGADVHVEPTWFIDWTHDDRETVIKAAQKKQKR